MSDGIRLNKYLSDAGICSRRQADKLIENGEITINGEVANLGSKVPEWKNLYPDPFFYSFLLIKLCKNTIFDHSYTSSV